ncbi:proteasome subunit beta type-7-like isoform X2 [Drosophila innubila]|uniref:proteasome subunit beta type-7-like isoform X2 n=1 Tax=Drosophila innubila TaxID=198719 RepID=UPI00148DE30E|nr:proteasome subunit beta type-7-like isoform X2 [Drosophila innubila]
MDHYIDGFNYGNCLRNSELHKMGLEEPKPIMANSTVVVIQFSDGIIIGADSRGTTGTKMILNNFNKIFQLHDNVFGVGLMCDLTKITRMTKGQLIMHQTLTNRRVLVITAKQVLKGLQERMHGSLLASFIIAGADKMGVHLYALHFDGTSEKLLFSSMGSGQYGSMSILEDRWRSDLDEDEARQLMLDAIAAGIINDVIPAFNVNLCIIRKDYSVEHYTETINNKINETQPAENFKTCVTFNRANWMQDVVINNPIVHFLAPPPQPAVPVPSGFISRNLLSITPASTNLQLKRGVKEEDRACTQAHNKNKRLCLKQHKKIDKK